MLNSQNFQAKIFVTIIILIYSSNYIKVSAQENTIQTSPFKECWKLETDQMISHEIESDNESSIYLPLLNGKISAIDFKTGGKIWEVELGGDIISSPNSDDKNIHVVSRTKTNIFLHSLSKNFGITNWKVKIDFFDSSDEVFLIKANDSLVIYGKNGKLLRVDKDNGGVIWSADSEQELSSAPILSGSQIIFGTTSNKILFYSAENGNALSQYDIPAPANIISIVRNKYLFWGDHKGSSYLSDLKTRKVAWQVRSGAGIVNILTTRHGVLLSSLDNFIYLISIETGKIVWKRRLSGRLSFNSINDEYLVTVIFASETVDMIDIENGKLINQFIIGGNNYFINKPHFSEDLYIFPTIKGLFAFTNTKTKCPSPNLSVLSN